MDGDEGVGIRDAEPPRPGEVGSRGEGAVVVLGGKDAVQVTHGGGRSPIWKRIGPSGVTVIVTIWCAVGKIAVLAKGALIAG